MLISIEDILIFVPVTSHSHIGKGVDDDGEF